MISDQHTSGFTLVKITILEMKTFRIFLLVCTIAQPYCAARGGVVSVTIEHQEVNILHPRYAVTEPSWVTELLGPTQFPVSTTKRPNFPQRFRETIKQVQTTINGIPNRINHIQTQINGIPNHINQIFQNIITGPGGPRTTLKPNVTSVAPS